mgnify:CR=1 FL=1
MVRFLFRQKHVVIMQGGAMELMHQSKMERLRTQRR